MASGELSRINTNIAALNALNALNSINTRIGIHSLRLATGRQINSASDDAAGFTIASKLNVKAEGLGVALDNIGSAKNLMTVAEGHLTNIQEILTKMKGKAQQAANDTLGTAEREAILAEIQEFNNQIDSEVNQAQWAGVSILGTGSASDMTFQIGVGTSSDDELSFNVADNTWAAGTNTTFNSEGLDVTASSSVIKTATVSGTTVGTFSGVSIGTSSTINGTFGAQLSSGTYTLEVTSTGGGTASQDGSSLIIRLKDSGGNYISIDSDGTVAGAGDYSTALSYSVAAGSTDPRSIDLGVGITVDLAGLSTADGDSGGSVTATIVYARAGNSVSTQANAQAFMDNIDSAIDQVSDGLAYIGQMFNRLTFQEESLTVAKSNTEAAYSRIVDADMAYEQLEVTKLMILQQTATAMLAQANVAPQSVLALFGG